MKRLCNIKYKRSLLLLAGLSPIGFPVQYLVIWQLNYCYGAIGSGVYCHMSFLNDYFVSMAYIFELSLLMMGIGLVWAGLAIYVWYMILRSGYNAVFSGYNAVLSLIHHISKKPSE